MVEEIAGGILSVRIRFEHALVGAILERPEVDALLGSAGVIGREEQEMLAVGQEPGPAMRCVLAGFELGQGRGGSARGASSPERVAVVGFVDDDVVLVPGPASGIGSLRENGDRAAR